jgi:hypothetical protein
MDLFFAGDELFEGFSQEVIATSDGQLYGHAGRPPLSSKSERDPDY